MRQQVVPLRLPAIDRTAIPSYGIARRAQSLILSGMLALLVAALVTSLVVHVDLNVDSAGAVQPIRTWPVRPLSGGVIVDITARTGDFVKRGQSLAQLDTLSASSELRNLRLQLAEGRAALQHARVTVPTSIMEQQERIVGFERAVLRAQASLRERLIDVGLRPNTDSVLAAYKPGTHQMIDLALADLRAAEADLRAGQSALARLRADSMDLARRAFTLGRIEEDIGRVGAVRQRMTITAPVSGTILTDQLERRLGELVQAGEQLLEIGEVNQWRVDLFVSERDVHDVKPGQRVSIDIPALEGLDGRRLNGRVVSVAPQPAVPPGIPTPAPTAAGYRITAALDSAQVRSMGLETLRTGYAVRGRIITRSGTVAALTVAYLRDRINHFR